MLAVIIIVLTMLLIPQQSKNIQLHQEINILEQNYQALKATNTALQQDNERLQREVGSLQSLAQQSTRELGQTQERIDDFETTVKESMRWFRDNSNFANVGYNETQQMLRDRCLQFDNASCMIDLYCIYAVNEENEFTYDDDIDLTGEEDFLQSLDSMYSKNKGDCEDFSLQFTAQYNFLADECLKNVSRHNIRLFTQDISVPGTYLYPVCGQFNPQALVENYAGHCLVAAVQKPINNSEEIYMNLRNAVLIEPQTGEYVLDLNDTASIFLFDDGNAPTTLYHLNTIITPDDLKLFYSWGEEVGWIGYADFLQEIEGEK